MADQTRSEALEKAAELEREAQRSEVKPNEAQSQKSAAIEQARPQPSEPLKFPPNTYTAKLFEVETSSSLFKVAGTLDGFLDFAIEGKGTRILTCEEALKLADSLKGAVADLKANCLYDKDALLAAAEPAPERTQLAQRILNVIMKHFDEKSGTSWKATLADLTIEQSELLPKLARAVAVPEPAQQESVAALKEIIKIFEEGSNGQPFTTLKRIATVAKTAIGEVV